MEVRNNRKTRQGVVVSNKMEKTIDKIDKYNTIHKKTVELLLIYIKIKLSIDFFNESGQYINKQGVHKLDTFVSAQNFKEVLFYG